MIPMSLIIPRSILIQFLQIGSLTTRLFIQSSGAITTLFSFWLSHAPHQEKYQQHTQYPPIAQLQPREAMDTIADGIKHEVVSDKLEAELSDVIQYWGYQYKK